MRSPVALGALLLAACAKPESPPPPRSIVVICIDTLRADHLGIYGYGRDTSPTLDALARRGAVFDYVLAQSNWTVPATASLMTSRYPSEHGAGLEGAVRALTEEPPFQIRKSVPTLADALQAAGLRTGLFSANPYLYGRFEHGFEHSEVGRKNAGALTDAALNWLGSTGSKPFFLYLQYMDLHQPIAPPEPYFNQFPAPEGGERGALHQGWGYPQQVDLEDAAFRRFRSHRLGLYDGALRYVDTEIARLLAGIGRLDGLEQTLVFVTSDHGEEFWDHAKIERRLGGDPRGFWGIGHGHSMFEELVRVPLIVHGPGVTAQRVACEARQIDLMPTALEMLAAPAPAGLRGRSFAALLRDGEREDCRPVPLIAESPAYGPDAKAIVWRRQKLIVRGDGVELLYDLSRDPGERVDLRRAQPELAATLKGALAKELASSPRPRDEAERAEFDEETRRQLESLGYLH